MMRNYFYNLLFEKHPASFRSQYDVQESVRRLSAIVSTRAFLSPFRQSLVGKVREQQVSLTRFIPFVGNPFAPVFYGSFRAQDGATILEGYFAFSLFSRIYNSIWLGFCLIFAILFLLAAILGSGPISSSPPMPQWQARLFLGLGPAFMVLLFVLEVKFSKWLARNDIPFIVEKVQSVLQFERIP